MTISAATSRNVSKALSCFMFDNGRCRRRAPDEQSRGLAERPQQQILDGRELRALASEPELDLLALVRHIERAEYPVPQRQAEAEVLAVVPWRGAVMDLVMRRALDDVAEPAADGQPDVAVAQMEDRQEEHEEDDVGFEQRHRLRRFAEQVDQGAVAEPRCCRDGVHLDPVVDRMR